MDGRFGGVGLARGSKTYWKSLFSHHLFLFDEYIYIGSICYECGSFLFVCGRRDIVIYMDNDA